MQTLFLVSAQMQSGKDVFGKKLAKEAHGICVAFANPLKEAAIALLGMPSEVAYGGEKERRAWKRYGKDAREWLQWFGVELVRTTFHPNVLTHRLLERIACGASSAFVVTDARMPDELSHAYDDSAWLAGLYEAGLVERVLLEGYRVVTIRLSRPGHENTDAHPTEAAQLGLPDSFFDEVIVNDGPVRCLDDHARRIAAKYR